MEIPFNRPTLPPYDLLSDKFKAFYDTGMITNGPSVKQFEIAIQNTLGVSSAVAVSSCTNGLMVVLRCLSLSEKVALPSFTFFATAHAAVWCGLEPVFVDVAPDTWNISPEFLERTLEEDDGISAIMGVHLFGNPCDVESLEALAHKRGLSLVYDSAHAMGAMVGDNMIGGFGDSEVFSLSPTKIVVAGEGGVITTNDAALAERLRAGRDYGNAGDYNPSFFGLNARMSEFHATLAMESFRMLELNVELRKAIAEKYVGGLSGLPGITFQPA